MVSEDSERPLEFYRTKKSWLQPDPLPSTAFSKSIRNRHEAWQALLTNTHKFLFQINPDTQYPHLHLCHLSLPKAKGKAYHTNSAPSFSSYESRQTKQIVKFPVVQMPKRFLCTKWPRCAGFVFFFRTHATAWHRLWVSHITLLCEKGKQNTQSIGIFLRIITTRPERLRDLPKIAWIGRILGNSQKQRRESRTYESPCKGPRLLEGKEEPYSDPKISSVWKIIMLRTNFCLYFPFLQENHQA